MNLGERMFKKNRNTNRAENRITWVKFLESWVNTHGFYNSRFFIL